MWKCFFVMEGDKRRIALQKPQIRTVKDMLHRTCHSSFKSFPWDWEQLKQEYYWPRTDEIEQCLEHTVIRVQKTLEEWMEDKMNCNNMGNVKISKNFKRLIEIKSFCFKLLQFFKFISTYFPKFSETLSLTTKATEKIKTITLKIHWNRTLDMAGYSNFCSSDLSILISFFI